MNSPSPVFTSDLTHRRLRQDLDGAYNDDAKPTSLGLTEGALLYGTAVWLVFAAILGSWHILRALWHSIGSIG